MKKDLPRLQVFLDCLPAGTRATFEFRHPSWFDDDVLEVLSEKNYPLCIADTDDRPATQLDRTADWGYLRLRRPGYAPDEIAHWRKWVGDQKWKTAYVFFKHEDEGSGPKMAMQFLAAPGP